MAAPRIESLEWHPGPSDEKGLAPNLVFDPDLNAVGGENASRVVARSVRDVLKGVTERPDAELPVSIAMLELRVWIKAEAPTPERALEIVTTISWLVRLRALVMSLPNIVGNKGPMTVSVAPRDPARAPKREAFAKFALDLPVGMSEGLGRWWGEMVLKPVWLTDFGQTDVGVAFEVAVRRAESGKMCYMTGPPPKFGKQLEVAEEILGRTGEVDRAELAREFGRLAESAPWLFSPGDRGDGGERPDQTPAEP